MSDFSIKQGDLRPALAAVLLLSDNSIVDLSGATVQFRMRLKGSTGAPKVDAAAVIIDANAGLVEYRWAGSDTDTIGSFCGEFRATLPGGLPQTHPNDGFLLIEVHADVPLP